MLEKGFNQFMLNSGENQFRSEKHFKPGPGVNADLRKLAQATLQQGGVTITSEKQSRKKMQKVVK